MIRGDFLSITVYVDELIFINIFVTFFLLISVCVFTSSPIRPLRILFSCLIGGVYSLIILAPPMHLLPTLLLRITVCILIVFVSDSFSSFRTFLKRIFAFLFMNFLFAGFMFCVNFFFSSRNIIYTGGAVYYNIGLPFIIILSVLSYLAVLLLSKLTSSSLHGEAFFKVKITCNGSFVTCNALFDTGNNISDPFSGKPVVIADKSIVLPLVSDEVKLFLGGVPLEKIPLSREWESRLRLIPYASIGGNGLLPSFRCDTLTVIREKGEITLPSLYIAVSDKTLSSGEYGMILPNSLRQYLSRSHFNEKSVIRH